MSDGSVYRNIIQGIGEPPGRNPERKLVAISGGFDPIHVGHVRLIKEASQQGDVIVILNSDAWLEKKKGYKFMDWDSRAEILLNMKRVCAVVEAKDEDGTVCESLKTIKPDFFANGGDRQEHNTPEKSVCEELGITMLWGIGGEKIASSSEIVRDAKI